MKRLIELTLEGLMSTAVEKICALGEVDAQEDLKRLREVYEDLVQFWGLDEEVDESYMVRFDRVIAGQRVAQERGNYNE